jgi:Uma2 family endonuclease
MTTPVAERLLTAEEFARTQDPPGKRTELVAGRVVEMPPAKTDHGYLGSEIGFALRLFAGAHNLGVVTGEGGYVISRNPGTVRAPDQAFISFERLGARSLTRGEYVEGAPTLAAEVVSPDDRDSDVAQKIREWLGAGADRVWEVHPRTQTVTVHASDAVPRTLGIGDALSSNDAGFVVEGFSLPLAELFR